MLDGNEGRCLSCVLRSVENPVPGLAACNIFIYLSKIVQKKAASLCVYFFYICIHLYVHTYMMCIYTYMHIYTYISIQLVAMKTPG